MNDKVNNQNELIKSTLIFYMRIFGIAELVYALIDFTYFVEDYTRYQTIVSHMSWTILRIIIHIGFGSILIFKSKEIIRLVSKGIFQQEIEKETNK